MPIYVYRCEACQALTEALQKVNDAPLVQCGECGAQSLKKILSPVGIVFKGSGFHKNDYSGKTSSTSSSDKKDTAAASPSDATAAPAPAASTGGESGGSSSSTSSNDTTSSGGSSDKVA